MILDILGLIVSAIVSFVVKGKKKEVLLNKISNLYVYRDSTNQSVTTCGVSILGDKKSIEKVIGKNDGTENVV